MRRKGISYVMSVMVMTLATVSIATVVFGWSLREVQLSQDTFGRAIQTRIEKTQERLVIEDVQFASSTQLKIYIRNVGAIQIVVDQAYLDHRAGTVASRLSLGIQKQGSITVTTPSTMIVGETYYLVVSTTRGNTVAGYFTY